MCFKREHKCSDYTHTHTHTRSKRYALYAFELTEKSAAKLPAIAGSFSFANMKKTSQISFNIFVKAKEKQGCHPGLQCRNT